MVRSGDVVQLSVRGRPNSKGRPRATASVHESRFEGPRAILRLVTPADTRRAEEEIAWEYKRRYPGRPPFVGAVMLQFTAVFPLLQSFSVAQRRAALEGRLYHTAKPDKDNIEKLICDALNGLAWIDDAQVQGGGVKRYGEAERIDITIRPLEQPDTPADQRRRRKVEQARLRV